MRKWRLVTLYAAEDLPLFEAYDKHLSALRQSLTHFHSGAVSPGQDVHQLDAELREADWIVCLLSADFIANRALMKHAIRHEAKLVPVCARPVERAFPPFAGRQTLPAEGTILRDGAIHEETLLGVIRGIASLLAYAQPLPVAPSASRDDLLSRVERGCQLLEDRKDRGAQLIRRPGPPPYEALIEVTYREAFCEQQYLVAALPRPPEPADLTHLARLLSSEYLPADPTAHAVLVHLGTPLGAKERTEAERQRIRVQPLADYLGLINFERYVAEQSQALSLDPVYPPSLYVAQRMVFSVGLGSAERQADSDALATIYDWLLSMDLPRFVLVLGDFGVGKTFLLHELARKLASEPGAPIPVLLEMRTLEKASSLDQLIAQHLARAGMEHISLPAFRHMLAEGRIALLFDGFDELALRVSYDRATEHLATVAQAAQGRAKIVLTSRTQHFRSDDQVKSELARRVEALPGHRAVRLLPFDDAQIRSFLERKLGDQAAAEERFRLLDEVKDLLGLSHNPRILSFIAQLPAEQLHQARRRRTVKAADLYRELLTWWIEREYERAHPPGMEAGLTRPQRWDAVEHLAQRLWKQTDRSIHVDQLGEAVQAALVQLRDIGGAVHQVAAGTLLCRDSEGRFFFIHQSVMEWLVARAMARELMSGGRAQALAAQEMSPLMAEFFMDLAGPETAEGWVSWVLKNQAADDILRKNAISVQQRLRGPLSGVNLRGQDLRGRRFAEQDLSGADLQDADLRGVDLRKARLRGADLSRADLSGADLRGADVSGAILDGTRLLGAKLVGAKLDERALREADCWSAAPVEPRRVFPQTCGPPRSSLSQRGMAFSPDGTVLAASWGDQVVRLWNVATGVQLRTFSGHVGTVESVSFNQDGRVLATASADSTVRLFDVATSAEIAVVQTHHAGVQCVRFSPDGKLLATVSFDGQAVVLDAASGARRFALSGVYDLAFSHDATLLAGSGPGGKIGVWHTASGESHSVLSGHEGLGRGVTFSPDGRTVAAIAEKEILLWDVATGACRRKVSLTIPRDSALSFSPDSRTLVVAGDGVVLVLDPASGSYRKALTCPTINACFSADGNRFAADAGDGTVCIRDLKTGVPVSTCSGRAFAVSSVAFSPDGALLATGASDSLVRLWDVRTGAQLRAQRGHSGSVRCVGFSPDGKLLASGATDRTVRISDARTGVTQQVIDQRADTVYGLGFSRDGSRLASGGGKWVYIWDVATGAMTSSDYGDWSTLVDRGATLDGFSFHGPAHHCWSAGLTRDGRTLVTGSLDNTVRVWDTSSRSQRRALKGHQGKILSTCVSADGRLVASAATDNTVRLWETVTGRCLAILVAGDDGWAALTPEGHYKAGGILHGEVWHAVHLCRFDLGELDPYLAAPLHLRDDHPLS